MGDNNLNKIAKFFKTIVQNLIVEHKNDNFSKFEHIFHMIKISLLKI
jgi:hypothetical protein